MAVERAFRTLLARRLRAQCLLGLGCVLVIGCVLSFPGTALGQEEAPAPIEPDNPDTAAESFSPDSEAETTTEVVTDPDLLPRRPPVFLEPLPPPEPPELPSQDRLAEALADQQLRQDTLLNLATLLTLRDVPRTASAEEATDRVTELLGHRSWIDTLTERYRVAGARSSMLDPAAWQVQVQLDRVGLATTLLAAPLGPGIDVLVHAVFDRNRPDLAAATLPELLWDLEVAAPEAWAGLQRRLENDPWLAVALLDQAGDWLAWPEPLPDDLPDLEAGGDVAAAESVEEGAALEPVEEDSGDRLLRRSRESLAVMLELASSVGPPDPTRLATVRRELLLALPTLDFGQRAHADGLLHLAGLVDALYRQNYLRFAEGLLAVTARLQDEAQFYPSQTRTFAAWLAEVLPGLSASHGRAFSAVDPKLNSLIATTYDVAQALSGELTGDDLAGLRMQLADAVAGLVLMIADLGFYFDQPVRDPIAGGVDACTGIAGQFDEDGSPAMTRELFDDCQEQLVTLANFEAREAQIAGNANGPFGVSQLRRELGLTSGQRINYGLGYLADRYDTGCPLPERPLPNPLEWAYLATFMAWFAEQSPVYFQAPENEERLERMRAIGEELVTQVAEQVDCLAGSGATINDPVERVTAEYATDLRALMDRLEQARSGFREARLAAGADIRLDAGADQDTAYRPAALEILPCDLARACEMTGALSSTRALTGLFDERYLVADQAGLGQVEICYGDMGWVDRRMEPVREGDDNVANFYGHLAFDLRGRFRDENGTRDLFAFRFTAPEESHYLFSAQREEVLEDACPVEWIGTRIVTELPKRRGGIVPNRLTYLSAARALPSRLLEANWDQGTEWRDWFVTGLGVESLEVPPTPDLGPRLDEYLADLYRQEQAALYSALATTGDGPDQLFEELDELSTTKLLLRTQMMLFFPHTLIHSDPVREAMAGQSGLLERRLVNRARQQDMPVDELMLASMERLGAFREEWRSLPETVRRRGSIADSVSHAMIRLDAIQRQFFAAPVDPPFARSAPSALLAPGGQGEENEIAAAQGEL